MPSQNIAQILFFPKLKMNIFDNVFNEILIT
jgi:hypothetical protein